MHYTESTQSIHRKIPIPPCSSVTLTWSIPHPRRPTSRQQKLSTIWSHNLFVPPDTAGHQLLINTKPAFKQQYSQYSSLYTRVIASRAILAPKLGYISELQLNMCRLCPLLLHLHNVYAAWFYDLTSVQLLFNHLYSSRMTTTTTTEFIKHTLAARKLNSWIAYISDRNMKTCKNVRKAKKN